MKANKPNAAKLVRGVMNEMRTEYVAFARLAVRAEKEACRDSVRFELFGKACAYRDAYLRLRRLLRQLEGK